MAELAQDTDCDGGTESAKVAQGRRLSKDSTNSPKMDEDPPARSSVMADGPNDEAHLCRVCMDGEESGPLLYPCKCKGSMRYVHEDCLMQWLSLSKKRSCEVCSATFEFRSEYIQGAPLRLTRIQVLLGALRLGLGNLPFFLRTIVVGMVWVAVLPFLNARFSDLFVAQSWSQARKVFVFEGTVNEFIRECGKGLVLSGLGIALSVVLYSRNLGHHDPHRRENQEEEEEEVEVEDEDEEEDEEEAPLLPADDVQEREARVEDDREDNDEEDRAIRPAVDLAEDLVAGILGRNDDEFDWLFMFGFRGAFWPGAFSMLLLSALNLSFLLVFELLPFSIGRLISYAMGPWLSAEDARQALPHAFKERGLPHSQFTTLLLLGSGYLAIFAALVCYTLCHTAFMTCTGRHETRNSSLLARLSKSIVSGIPIWGVIVMELFVDVLVVGVLVHLAILGLSGDVGTVFYQRVESCSNDPLTCLGVHWVLGSRLSPNGPFIIQGFRKILHPNFRARFLAAPQIHQGQFAELFESQNRLAREQNENWHKKIRLATLAVLDGTRPDPEEIALLRWDHAPLPDPIAQTDMHADGATISFGFVWSILYCTKVVLWTIPLVVTLIFLPVQIVKLVFPWLFPLRFDKFEPKLHMAFLLMQSIPNCMEALGVGKNIVLLGYKAASWMAKLLDLEGFVVRPELLHMHSCYVYVDKPRGAPAQLLSHNLPKAANEQEEHPSVSLQDSQVCSSPEKAHHAQRVESQASVPTRSASCEAIKHMRVPMPGAVQSLQELSGRRVLESIDIIGVVCAIKPWINLSPIFRRGRYRRWQKRTSYVFTVADAFGHCVPVYIRLPRIKKQRFTQASDDVSLSKGVVLSMRELCQRLSHLDADARGKCEAIKKFSSACETALDLDICRDSHQEQDVELPDWCDDTDKAEGVVSMVRQVLQFLGDRQDLVDVFFETLPNGLGTSWENDILRGIRQISRLFRDGNHAMVALRNVKVCDIQGRSLLLDNLSQVMVEPDSGCKSEVTRVCFEMRRDETPTSSQFCVLQHEPPHLQLRVFAFIWMAVLSGILASTFVFVVPLMTGRAMALVFGDVLENDLYYWAGGGLVVWGCIMSSSWVVSTYRSAGNSAFAKLVNLTIERIYLGLKWLCFIGTFGLFLPLLTGIFTQLVLLNPLRVPEANRLPAIMVVQDWSLGLTLLIIGSSLLLMGVFGNEWARRVERVHNNGYDIHLAQAIQEVALPLTKTILFCTCCPYVLSRTFATCFALDPFSAEHALQSSFPAFFVLYILVALLRLGWRQLNELHDVIFDSQYRIGLRLQNAAT